jgi:hypothetical protein
MMETRIDNGYLARCPHVRQQFVSEKLGNETLQYEAERLFKPATESTKIATEASKEKHDDTSAALKSLRAQLAREENPFATFLRERVLPAPSWLI